MTCAYLVTENSSMCRSLSTAKNASFISFNSGSIVAPKCPKLYPILTIDLWVLQWEKRNGKKTTEGSPVVTLFDHKLPSFLNAYEVSCRIRVKNNPSFLHSLKDSPQVDYLYKSGSSAPIKDSAIEMIFNWWSYITPLFVICKDKIKNVYQTIHLPTLMKRSHDNE